jgi:hypothetical protein
MLVPEARLRNGEFFFILDLTSLIITLLEWQNFPDGIT